MSVNYNNRKKFKTNSPVEHPILPLSISSYDDTLLLHDSNNSLEKLPTFQMSTSGIEKQAEGSSSINNSLIINLFPTKSRKQSGYNNINDKEVSETHCQFKPDINHKEMRFDGDISQPFGYIICDTITTYFFGENSYSEFTNIDRIPKDVPLVFLKQSSSNSTDRFSLNSIVNPYNPCNNNTNNDNTNNEISNNNSNSSSGCSNLSVSTLYSKFDNIDKKEKNKFFKELNDFFLENDYIQIMNSHSQNKICCIITMLILLGIIIGFILFLSIQCTTLPLWVIIVGSISVLCFLFLEWILWKKKQDIPFKALKDELLYRYDNVSKKNKFEKDWNKKLFEVNDMYMIIPLSFHYVMFNIDVEQKIQIISHDLSEKNAIFP